MSADEERPITDQLAADTPAPDQGPPAVMSESAVADRPVLDIPTELPKLGPKPQRVVGKWTVALSIAFGSLMATIDTSIVNVAMPQIRGQLGASLQEITLITTAYMIAMVLIMPMTGFLGSLFGQKRVYMTSLVIFTAGSVMCGFSRSLGMLVVARIVQGIGGGALQPTQQAILRQTFPPEEQGMAMAVFSMVIMVGPAVGPVLGGYITDNYSWPWIFFVNLPVGILGIYMTQRNVIESPEMLASQRQRGEAAKKNFDWQGIALMTLAIGALQYVLEEGSDDDWFTSERIVIVTFISAVALIAFVIRELTAEAPVVNIRMFRDPTFASGTVIAAIVFAMLMGSMFLLPVFTQELLHYNATQSGIVLLPRTIAMMFASPFIGKLYNKTSPAVLVGVGMVLTAIGCWMQTDTTLLTSTGSLIWPLAVTGMGFAFLFVPLTTAALSTVPKEEMAGAAGVNSFLRQVGGSIGLSIFATMFTTFGREATTGLRSAVTSLRPEVMAQVGGTAKALMARGMSLDTSYAVATQSINGRAMLQGTVIGFDKMFWIQSIAFILVIPLLFFLRVPRNPGEKAHVELGVE